MQSIRCPLGRPLSQVDGKLATAIKHGGQCLMSGLVRLLVEILDERDVLHEFKDAVTVQYFSTMEIVCCDNHKITLYSPVLARVLMNRLNNHVLGSNIIHKSQCGFLAGRGTMDIGLHS